MHKGSVRGLISFLCTLRGVCVTVVIEKILSIMKFHPQEGFYPAGNILILKTKIIIAALAFHWLQGEGHNLTFL